MKEIIINSSPLAVFDNIEIEEQLNNKLSDYLIAEDLIMIGHSEVEIYKLLDFALTNVTESARSESCNNFLNLLLCNSKEIYNLFKRCQVLSKKFERKFYKFYKFRRNLIKKRFRFVNNVTFEKTYDFPFKLKDLTFLNRNCKHNFEPLLSDERINNLFIESNHSIVFYGIMNYVFGYDITDSILYIPNLKVFVCEKEILQNDRIFENINSKSSKKYLKLYNSLEFELCELEKIKNELRLLLKYVFDSILLYDSFDDFIINEPQVLLELCI